MLLSNIQIGLVLIAFASCSFDLQCLVLNKYMSWLGLYLSDVIIFNFYLHMVGLPSIFYHYNALELSHQVVSS